MPIDWESTERNDELDIIIRLATETLSDLLPKDYRALIVIGTPEAQFSMSAITKGVHEVGVMIAAAKDIHQGPVTTKPRGENEIN